MDSCSLRTDPGEDIEHSANAVPWQSLPQELVDHIIDCLHDDNDSLRACATVCKTWLPRSRVYLHRSLSLYSRRRCEEAAALYENVPLARCVRELQLFDRTSGNERDWVNVELAAVLRHLRGVPTEGMFIGDAPILRWELLGPSVTELFKFPTIQSLTLRRMEFRNFDMFTAFLSRLPYLSTLVVDELSFQEIIITDRLPLNLCSHKHLRTLIIRAGPIQHFLLNWFLNQPPETIGLTKFAYLAWRPFDRLAPEESVRALGASVQDLTVSVDALTQLPMSKQSSVTFGDCALIGSFRCRRSFLQLFLVPSKTHVSP